MCTDRKVTTKNPHFAKWTLQFRVFIREKTEEYDGALVAFTFRFVNIFPIRPMIHGWRLFIPLRPSTPVGENLLPS